MDLELVHFSNSVIKELLKFYEDYIMNGGIKDHRSRDSVRGVAGVSGAVRETAGCKGNYWTAIGGNDGIFSCYTQTEGLKNFE